LHPARAFHESNPAVLAQRAAERGFAVIIGVKDGRPLVAHAPVLLDEGRLRFHLSAANPLSETLRTSGWALAVITGEDAYVSPDWYGLADQVPTWNYLSVEIDGPVRALDRAATTGLLDDLAARYESGLAPKPPWTRSKMDPARFEALLSGIVAFEMMVKRLSGVTKLSQNKPPEVAQRVAEALGGLHDAGAQAIAVRMLRLQAAE
jgi:transcriptional regulator